MEDIKREDECCFCFGKEELLSLLEPYSVEENVEIYSTIIAECFQIELNSFVEDRFSYLYLICKNCVSRLKDAAVLRSQIKTAYDRLEAKRRKNDESVVIASEISDLIETKENIPEFDSEATSSNDEEEAPKIKLKCLRIILPKLNASTIEKYSTVSTIQIADDRLEIERVIPSEYDDSEVEPTKKFTCNICSKPYQYLRSMEKHERLHSSKNTTTCRHCNKTFKHKRSLLAHQKLHTDIENLICDYCKRGFRQKAVLQNHILLHMGVKNKKCDLCNRYFVSKVALSSHKRRCHKCEICSEFFAILNRHKTQLHSKPNKYTCEQCNKEFSLKHNLVAHEKTHLNRKDFICDFCNKRFRSKATLKRHILLYMRKNQ